MGGYGSWLEIDSIDGWLSKVEVVTRSEESSTLLIGGEAATDVHGNSVGDWSSSISVLFHLKILKHELGGINLDVHALALR